MIYHVHSDYAPADPNTARRMRIAAETWKRQRWIEVPVPDSALPRLFTEKGRAFPYVKDIFDYGAHEKEDDDILILTNSDIMVRGDCCSLVAERLQIVDACFCCRRDFHHTVESPIPDRDFEKGIDYPGTDLVACRVWWWREARGHFPDMLLGMEAWDAVMRCLIMDTNPQGETRIHNIICHERHGSYWENPAHRYTLRSQNHNLGLARGFLRARGINPSLYGIP